jgi:hypothetical protein
MWMAILAQIPTIARLDLPVHCLPTTQLQANAARCVALGIALVKAIVSVQLVNCLKL